MKKLFFFSQKALLFASMLTLAACSSDDDEPSVKTTTVTFEEPVWAQYIDSPQYYGPLLYGDGTYAWTDPATSLSSELSNDYADGFYWGGGIAISNYIHNADLKTANYEKQLAVAASNGSKNFAVACSRAYFYFKDNSTHIIESMRISPTAYVLNTVKNGNDFSKPLTGASDYYSVIATGYVGDAVTGKVEIRLVDNGVIEEGWRNVSLASLGQVNRVEFTYDGSDKGAYGLNTPQYFAFDDVKIR